MDLAATRNLTTTVKRLGGGYVVHGGEACKTPTKVDIGNREIVGFGINGNPDYADSIMYPFPAIRFQEDTPEVLKLREKEKGDWKKMTVAEKKQLYRASFCLTFAEFKGQNMGEWKGIIGSVFLGIAVVTTIFMTFKMFVYPPMPVTFSDESLKAQIQRRLDIESGPVQGFSSNWDPVNNKWKN